MGEGIEQQGIEVLNNSDLIYIYGMSLGATDKRWWERVIHRMINSPSTVLIINDINTPIIGLRSTEYDRYGRKKKTSFLEYGSSLNPEIKKDLMKRMFITSENIFRCIKNLANNSIPSAEEGQ